MKDITLGRLEDYLRWRQREASLKSAKIDLWCLRRFLDYGVKRIAAKIIS